MHERNDLSVSCRHVAQDEVDGGVALGSFSEIGRVGGWFHIRSAHRALNREVMSSQTALVATQDVACHTKAPHSGGCRFGWQVFAASPNHGERLVEQIVVVDRVTSEKVAQKVRAVGSNNRGRPLFAGRSLAHRNGPVQVSVLPH